MLQKSENITGAVRSATPTNNNLVLGLGELLELPPGVTMKADEIKVNSRRKTTWDPNGRATETSDDVTVSLRGGAIVASAAPAPVPAPAPAQSSGRALRAALVVVSGLWRLLEWLATLDGGTGGLQRLRAGIKAMLTAWAAG